KAGATSASNASWSPFCADSTRSRCISAPRCGTAHRRRHQYRRSETANPSKITGHRRTASSVLAVLDAARGMRGSARGGPGLGVLDRDLARHVGLDGAARLGHLAGLLRLRRLGAHERLGVLALDERLDAVERDVVVDLDGRALHE